MPYEFDSAGYPAYIPSNAGDDDYYLRPVVPSPRPSPGPSPHGSPNPGPMLLDEYYNYVHPGTGVVGIPMMPAGIVPLPASPSMLASWVPLPPSPHASPRLGNVQLTPGGTFNPFPAHPQSQYLYGDYRYFVPQAGMYYNNPHFPPPTKVHPLLKDAYNLRLDLASHTFAPHMLSGNWPSWKFVPLHPGYLSSVATYPSTHEIRVICKAFGRFADAWAIKVKPGRTVSAGDVLHAIHEAVYKQMTHAEWAALTERECYDAGKSYTRRCRGAEFEKIKGVRRVDLLGEKHWFGGLTKARDDDPHHLELHVTKAG